MKIFFNDLSSSLGQLVMNEPIVMLVSMQLAQVHWFHHPRTSTQERFDASVLHC